MNRGEIRKRIESALQDETNRHWTDDNINFYIDDAQKEFVRKTKHPTTTAQLSIGPSADKTGTISVDGRTLTASSTGHSFLVGDAIYFTGFAPVTEYDDQTFIVRRSLENSFVCLLDQAHSLPSGHVNSGSFRKLGPTFSKPSEISEILSITLDGVELEFLSEGEINALAFRSSGDSQLLNGEFGLIPNPFGTKIPDTGEHLIRWRDQQGSVQAIIMPNRFATTFRIYPVPYQIEHMYIDKEADTKFFKSFEIRGVVSVTKLATDSSTPQVNEVWHEALVLGALERAYLKETNLRNVEKSMSFQQKFTDITRECQLSESINSASYGGGRNENVMRVVR